MSLCAFVGPSGLALRPSVRNFAVTPIRSHVRLSVRRHVVCASVDHAKDDSSGALEDESEQSSVGESGVSTSASQEVTEQTKEESNPGIDSGGGAGHGDGGSGGRGGDGESEDDSRSWLPFALVAPVAPRARQARNFLMNEILLLKRLVHWISTSTANSLHVILKVVPPQVLVAIISVISTLAGAKVKSRNDIRAKERARIEAARKAKAKLESDLRNNYQTLANSLLKSAIKLAERLVLVVEHSSLHCDPETPDCGTGQSPVYSAYLLARYLATVELFKKRSSVLDLGFPAADRIFLNILGRIQGVLAADDAVLKHMQETERYFKPGKGRQPMPAGPLQIMPRAQLCIGELVLRRDVTNSDTRSMTAEEVSRQTTNSIISYAEFSRQLQEDTYMERWFSPVIESFRQLEHSCKHDVVVARRAHKKGNGQPERRTGARVFFLQAALMDLVDFLDPGPECRFIPMHQRRRLRAGPQHFHEEQRMPKSLHLLYEQLAILRDNRVHDVHFKERLKLQEGVEVYVKSPETDGESTIEPKGHGDCPFSQRVLLVLEEMEIPYKAVAIPSDAKPSWFHLLHPLNLTPVIYHEGQLVGESKQIISYLLHKFPNNKKLAQTDHLRLAVGTAAFTRFHPRFKAWLAGEKKALQDVENELRHLNKTLAIAQERNEGKPFLGGENFSREDTAIVPVLHHLEVAGRALKQWSIPKDCDAVIKYLEAAREMASFKKTAASPGAIIAGYGRLVKNGGEPRLWLADILE